MSKQYDFKYFIIFLFYAGYLINGCERRGNSMDNNIILKDFPKAATMEVQKMLGDDINAWEI